MATTDTDGGQDSIDFGISPEFIEEGRKHNLVKPRKKFAPYTKAQRRKRRSEVYKLHFELGIPALRIAEIMHVDKNTIYNDLQTLYQEVTEDQDKIGYSEFFTKQLVRLETQRTRLLSYLENTKDIEKKLSIERMIADIDFKLATATLKVAHASEEFYDAVIEKTNKMAAANKLNHRYTTFSELIKISQKSREKLDGIIERLP
jgi:hypothetical protein